MFLYDLTSLRHRSISVHTIDAWAATVLECVSPMSERITKYKQTNNSSYESMRHQSMDNDSLHQQLSKLQTAVEDANRKWRTESGRANDLGEYW